MIADPEAVTAAVREKFQEVASGRELRLSDVVVLQDELHVTFAGLASDPRGPYGVRITVPRDTEDPILAEHGVNNLEDWALWAVVYATREAYDTKARSANASGGEVTWLSVA